MKKKLKYIGERIRLVREHKGLSLEQLAEAADLSESFVGLVERGMSGVSVESLINIAKVLDVSTDELIKQSVKPTLSDKPSAKDTLLTLVKSASDEDVAFMLEFYELYRKHRKQYRG